MDTSNSSLKIPYSPSLALIESYVAIFKIYVLKNPITGEIFYVGQTMQDLKTRLSGHLSETGANRDKINYVKSILNAGEKPIIETIEVIKTTCYIDRMMVNEREFYWIRYYKSLGCTLLNCAGTSPDSNNRVYNGYLSSLKRGETQWQYYFCGKTAGGYLVYDAEKLKLDGFAFPHQPIIETKISLGEPNYHPFESDRFLLKAGLERSRPQRTVVTEVFPEQPQWSNDFLNCIYNTETEFDEFEDDWSDPDLELTGDDEPDEYLEESETENEYYEVGKKHFNINEHLLF